MNNFKHIWSVACQKTLVDANTNILSLLEVLEKIDINIKNASKIKDKNSLTVPIHFEVTSFWRKIETNKAVQGEAKIVIYSPQNAEIANASVKFTISAKAKSSRTIVKINGMRLTGPGEYKIEVQEKVGQEHIVVAEIPFDVTIETND